MAFTIINALGSSNEQIRSEKSLFHRCLSRQSVASSTKVCPPASTALSNGNYVVASRYWNGARGAATWGSGTTGVRGTIDASHRLPKVDSHRQHSNWQPRLACARDPKEDNERVPVPAAANLPLYSELPGVT
jgi:hypothetical protein